MATTATRKEGLQLIPDVKISGFRRYMVLRAHPMSIFMDAAALIWVVYFLWQHAWQLSLLIIVLERGFTWILTQSVNSDALGETILGKLALLHLHPFNLTVQLIGVVLSAWGIWMHDTIPILGGASLILIGHTFGWRKIHKALDCRIDQK